MICIVHTSCDYLSCCCTISKLAEPLLRHRREFSYSVVLVCAQAALPDMLRTASAPVAGASAQASPAQQHSQHHSQQHSRQHSQQHRQQYSGPYGLVDDEEEGDDDEGDTNAGHAQVPNGATLNDQPAAPQGQADVEEGVRAGQAPPLSHGIPFMHPPHLRQPMCRLFRYTCGLCCLCTGGCSRCDWVMHDVISARAASTHAMLAS